MCRWIIGQRSRRGSCRILKDRLYCIDRVNNAKAIRLIISGPRSVEAEETAGNDVPNGTFHYRCECGSGLQRIRRTAKRAGFCEILIEGETQRVPRFKSSGFELDDQVWQPRGTGLRKCYVRRTDSDSITDLQGGTGSRRGVKDQAGFLAIDCHGIQVFLVLADVINCEVVRTTENFAESRDSHKAAEAQANRLCEQRRQVPWGRGSSHQLSETHSPR